MVERCSMSELVNDEYLIRGERGWEKFQKLISRGGGRLLGT